MKIILFCASQANQKALAHKIHDLFKLEKIIVFSGREKDSKVLTLKIFFNKVINFLGEFLTFFKFRNSWFDMLNYYLKIYPDFPIKPELYVSDINEEMVSKIIDQSKPELVIISGTNLLKDGLLNKINKYGKAMNLHTGISPFIKGGPDCTNWALYLKEFNLIGNTIMWIDKGIDSGNIITTEQTDLTGKESLTELRIKVMNHGHELFIKVIDRFNKELELPNIHQSDLSPRRLFLTKDWGIYKKIVALFNFYVIYNSKSKFPKIKHKLISLK